MARYNKPNNYNMVIQRELNHSYPWNSYPSSLDNKDKDIGFSRSVSEWYNIAYPNRPQINFNIYKMVNILHIIKIQHKKIMDYEKIIFFNFNKFIVY